MTAIMSIDEPRPRGTYIGERADRRRVREAEHYFRCKICGGFIDARDVAWVEDHEGSNGGRLMASRRQVRTPTGSGPLQGD
jgi:hypothetical protein